MRAAVIEEIAKPLVVRDVPDPQCPPDGAIIRVGANGICRTDWHLWTDDWKWRGLAIEPPFVLGHEFTGIVEEVGSEVRDWQPGDRVIYPMNPGDGICEFCRDGHQHICDAGADLVPGVSFWGAFGEYTAVRYADVNLVRLPDELSFVDTAALACRYMAAYHGVTDLAEVSGGEWVAVHGTGGMGMAAVQVAVAVGARVIAVDTSPTARALAREIGAEHVIDPRETTSVAVIREITRGGAQVSFDTLGIAETCLNSVRSLRKRGRHIQLGHTTSIEAGMVPLPIDEILLNEYRLLGGFGLQGHRFDPLLAMCAAGKLEPCRLVTRRVQLDGVTDVLKAMGRYEVAGVAVIDFECGETSVSY